MTELLSTGAPNTKIGIHAVYKIFGSSAAQACAMQLLRDGHDKTSVQKQTGASVGLAGINANIPAGRITCVMGLSGSGKSTLVRHLNRLIDPSAGEIRVDGQDILSMSLPELRVWRRHAISMVFQNFGLLPHLDVLANVAFGLTVRGEPAHAANDVARQWLERVNLAGYEQRYPDELSGGMRQRVGLARALAIDADILLMDEAFSALDPLIRDDMQDELVKLQQQLRKTIVFVTHDIDEALRLGDHIIILRDGRLEQAGSAQTIRTQPVNDYVRRFVTPRGSVTR